MRPPSFALDTFALATFALDTFALAIFALAADSDALVRGLGCEFFCLSFCLGVAALDAATFAFAWSPADVATESAAAGASRSVRLISATVDAFRLFRTSLFETKGRTYKRARCTNGTTAYRQQLLLLLLHGSALGSWYVRNSHS